MRSFAASTSTIPRLFPSSEGRRLAVVFLLVICGIAAVLLVSPLSSAFAQEEKRAEREAAQRAKAEAAAKQQASPEATPHASPEAAGTVKDEKKPGEED